MYMLYYNNIYHVFFASSIYDPELIGYNICKDVLNLLVVSRWFVNFVLRLYEMSEIGPSLYLLSVLIVLIVNCLPWVGYETNIFEKILFSWRWWH